MKYLFLGLFYLQVLIGVHLKYSMDKNWQKVRSPSSKTNDQTSLLKALHDLEAYSKGNKAQ